MAIREGRFFAGNAAGIRVFRAFQGDLPAFFVYFPAWNRSREEKERTFR